MGAVGGKARHQHSEMFRDLALCGASAAGGTLRLDIIDIGERSLHLEDGR
jgi:hypothetical protein